MRVTAHLRPLTATVTVLLFAHCASSGQTESSGSTSISTRVLATGGRTPIETTDVNGGDEVRIGGSRSDALVTLTEIYGDLKIPIGMSNPASGQIGNVNLRIPGHRLNGRQLSDYLNCGSESMVGQRADLDEVTLMILSQVSTAKDGATTVTTTVHGRARPSGTSSSAVDCESRGLLERTIAERLTKALGAPKADSA
jgi:hypothetical protein